MKTADIYSLVTNRYSMGEGISVRLLRSYTNDVYIISSSEPKAVLKIFSTEWRSKDEILWENDLLNYLATNDFVVPQMIQGRDGKEVYEIENEDKTYFAVLYEYARGEKPTPPFSPSLYEKVGCETAALHEATQNFSSIHTRPHLDTKYFIDDSLSVLATTITDEDTLDEYKKLGSFLEEKLSENTTHLDTGVVHGDLTFDNLHISKTGEIMFYDFDSSGIGCRAIDLQGWVVLHPEKQSHIQAFLNGYKKVRPVSDELVNAAPYFQAANDMWLRKGMKALHDKKVLHQQYEQVRKWNRYFQL